MQASDRGTKKWTALMLTEHQEALTKLFNEEQPVEKPLLSEDQAAEINFKLNRSDTDNLTVKVTHFADGYYQKENGKITSVHYEQEWILIGGKKINLDDIFDVEIL